MNYGIEVSTPIAQAEGEGRLSAKHIPPSILGSIHDFSSRLEEELETLSSLHRKSSHATNLEYIENIQQSSQ